MCYSITSNLQQPYFGQAVTGRVECNFLSEDKVRAIRLRFRGKAKVQWHETRNTNYYSDETYYENESDLLTGETTFPPGKYSYPFIFNLPTNIPPSLDADNGKMHGKVKHSSLVTIDRPWAIDIKSKGLLDVHSLIDLNRVDSGPLEVDYTKKPFAVIGETGPITLTVRVHSKGVVPNQMVTFKARVVNRSKISVKDVRFQLVQGYKYITVLRTTTVDKIYGGEFAVIDSSVEPRNEKSWDLELRVPPNVNTENLFFCKIIKSYFELRGELSLPLPHKNLKMTIPLVLGTVPLHVTK